MNQTVTEQPAAPVNTNIPLVIYVLYLLALVSGITAVIGVIMAYVYKDDSPAWLRSHYEMQIRTFWVGLVAGTIAFILMAVLIGFPLALMLAVWWIIRCVKGLRHLDRREPYPNHLSWGI